MMNQEKTEREYKGIAYTLIRSRRRTLTIQIRPDGAVTARAPMRMPLYEINRFIDSKRNWIQKNQKKLSGRWEKHQEFKLDYGSKVRLLGEYYEIFPGQASAFSASEKRVYLPDGLNHAELKDAMIALYRKTAREILTDRTQILSEIIGVHPAKIRIGSAKTRWGCCSSKKNITYSWKLIMAPEDAVDYVVIHELCHLKHMNHSRAFWLEVSRYCNNVNESKKKLTALSEAVSAENWELSTKKQK